MTTDTGRETSATKDGVYEVLLALSAAAFAFLCLVAAYLKGGISENEEARLFVASCIVVPLVGIFAADVCRRTKRHAFPGSTLFYPVLAAGHVAFWAVAMHRLRALSPEILVWKEVDPSRPDFYGPCWRLVVAWLAGNVALLGGLWLLRARLASSRAPIAVRVIDRLLPFGVVAALLPFASRSPIPREVVVIVVIAGFASTFHTELAAFPKHRPARLAFDALVLVGIALLVIDPAMDVHYHHYNFFLGPVAAVRAGRTLLVDVACQYGVANIYLLGAIFDLHTRALPASADGFATILGILATVQWAVVYGTLRSTTKSPALSAFVILLIVLSPRLEQLDYPSMYPSTGAFRFLFGFLLVGCFALRERLPSHPSWVYALEAVVLGVSSIWSFESFVYVLIAYLGSLIYEAAHVGLRKLRTLAEDRVGPALLAMSMCHAALGVFTRWRSGHWPRWSMYVDFVRLYSTDGFGSLPAETWAGWPLVCGAFMVTIIALGYRRIVLGRTDLKTRYAVVFGMSALGVAQFTYYVGRSHPNNLFYIAPPAFFVAGFWFILAAEWSAHVSNGFRRSFLFVGSSCCAFVLVHATPDIVKKIDHSWLAYLASGQEWTRHPTQPRVIDALVLMNKYAPGQGRVAFFAHPDTFVEMSLRSRRTSIWPETYATEDGLLESTKNRIFDMNPGLKAGNIVFVDTGSTAPIKADDIRLVQGAEHIDRELFNRLVSRFRFEIVEARPSGVVAVRLIDR